MYFWSNSVTKAKDLGTRLRLYVMRLITKDKGRTECHHLYNLPALIFLHT